MKKLNTILLLSALILASACEKDDEPEAPLSIKTQMLVNPSWETTAFLLVNIDTEEVEDVTEEMSCYKDNFLKFNKNGNYDMNEGSDVCEDEEQNSRGTWKFNTDETRITFTDEEGPNEVEVLELTEDELIFAMDEILETEAGDFVPVFVFEAKE